MPTDQADRSVKAQIEYSADPARTARAVARITETVPDAQERLEADPALRTGLIAVVAASPWLARVCATDPQALQVLADLDQPVVPARADERPPADALRDAKQRELLRLAARDILGIDQLEQTGTGLSVLASELLEAAWEYTVDTSHELAVIGMGKLGAGELNYASDIDLLLVSANGAGHGERSSAPDPGPFLALARAVWRTDLDLRPEGRSGALVRSVASYRAYWERWAEVWEFQALLKGRPVSGNVELGERFYELAQAQVWGRPFGPDELAQLRRMKARSEGEITRRGLSERELKRGRGGIRDVEFAIQLLQLVHGRSDTGIRVPSTLSAIAALARGGYVAAEDATALEAAYRFLRTVEHRLQLYEGQQVHTVPAQLDRRTHLARVLGYRDGAATTAVGRFEADLRFHQARVRSIHQRLFFRPLLEIFTGTEPRTQPGATAPQAISPEAAATRLSAFGFTDAERTRRAVTELTGGFSRSSQLMQQMLPLLLDWLSGAADPDQGLLGLTMLAGERHARDRLTALCRESPMGARQLCELLGSGGRFSRDLLRHPEVMTGLASGDFPRPAGRGDLDDRLHRSLAWRGGPGAVEVGLRVFFQSEILRVAARDVLGLDDVEATGEALSDLADAVIGAAVGEAAAGFPMAVIGVGRLGGREMGYGSDVDLLFVHDVPDGTRAETAATTAEAAAGELTRLISGATPATGVYRVDLALRPEGRQGPAIRSLAAYAAYYERWAEPWERQALLRGRFVAGDSALGDRFAALARSFVWDRPFNEEDVRAIRRIKARVERERVPAGEDPKFHLKLGPGSMTDIEWTAQLLQLRHGVRATGTVEALEALASQNWLSADDAHLLLDSYRFCERARNRLHLIREVAGDSLPGPGRLLETLSRSMGTTSAGLRNEYARRTRRARRVVERLFYGLDQA
ncbi:MAG: bifunctional [glutamine synthetase] adenylyltransferase/[glutamine synthetase]-adenylyl-L-tyrosine phosphorylase [Acidimicrobiales bacterium]|nr:bifunctional [glutamine synthetase] adenylyltransferase/[glutamine synthetase]-adenylyl-L-tyrosine phosphorylase [Acidimicrobiales bacterium]